MESIVKIKFGNNSDQFCCNYFVPSSSRPLSFPIFPKTVCPKASILQKVCVLLPIFPMSPTSQPLTNTIPLSVSGSLTFFLQTSALRYLALHCPLVLSSELTRSRLVKSPHCLPPMQSFLFHFNSWVCLLVLHLNWGFLRLFTDNGVFVHTGIQNAPSPALKIFFPSLLSYQ